MERNSEERIIELLDQIIKLLEEHDEDDYWGDGIKRFREDFVYLTHSKTRQEAASTIMSVIIGGMGSLADLSLAKDDKYQREQTKLLHDLRRQLFNECLSFRAH